eukprot:gene28748-32465_t
MAREQVTEILAEMVANVLSTSVVVGDTVAPGDSVLLLAPKPATVPTPVVGPVVEPQLAPIEEDYVEEGELDEADMTAEDGQEYMDGGWDESNADSGDFEEGEI